MSGSSNCMPGPGDLRAALGCTRQEPYATTSAVLSSATPSLLARRSASPDPPPFASPPHKPAARGWRLPSGADRSPGHPPSQPSTHVPDTPPGLRGTTPGFQALPAPPRRRAAVRDGARNRAPRALAIPPPAANECAVRSEEHTSELQSLRHLVCRLLLEK